MILIVSLCKEKLYEFEFVKPIEKIVGKNYFVRNYKNLSEEDLFKADKVILSGTSLKDFEYLDNLDKFLFLKNFNKPVLGICAGMQVIGITYGGKLIDNKEVGNISQKYFLHNKEVSLPHDFEILEENEGRPISFKHKSKEIYGVLFHPEVLNPEVIETFINFK